MLTSVEMYECNLPPYLAHDFEVRKKGVEEHFSLASFKASVEAFLDGGLAELSSANQPPSGSRATTTIFSSRAR